MSSVSPTLLTSDQQWLAKIYRMQRKTVHAIEIGGTDSNTPTQYNLLSADTLTLPANTYKSINFSVILGSVLVSMDGGSTTVTYPIGSNVNMSASSTLDMDFVFTVSGSASDGMNSVIIQTVSA